MTFRDDRATLHALLAADQPAFGLWMTVSDPIVAEVLAAAPFDFVLVDLQHGAAGWSELPGINRALRAHGRAMLVRVPWNRPEDIMRAIDLGAAGVIVPMVNCAAEAAAAAQACRFPPRGQRSWGPLYGGVRPDGALPPEQQDDGVVCYVMVETKDGLDAVNEIAATEGVDGIFVGPNDLALGCGLGRATYRDSAEVDALLASLVDACRAAGITGGLYCSDTEMAAHWAGRGMRLLIGGTDTALLVGAVARAWDELAPGRQGREA